MEEQKVTNILIAGVGGQGTLLASDIISRVAMEHGFDVKKSEVHGMAQRGGSVISHIRFGKKVYSPLIQKGKADFLISFEKLEALRYIDFTKKDGRIIVNDQEIIPMTVYTGDVGYPGDIEEQIRKFTKHLLVIDALEIARTLGNKSVVNIVMLGALSHYLEFDAGLWEKVMTESIPRRFLEVNRKAFSAGRSFSELREFIRGLDKKTVVIPMAEDDVSISTAVEGGRGKIADFFLLGNKAKIAEKLSQAGGAPSDYEIIPEEDPVRAAQTAVRLIREGKADILLKGHLQTYQLMKAVLHAEEDLRTGRLLSDVFLFEDPRTDVRKLTAITDGGVSVLPNLAQKRQIIENAVEVFHALGHADPKVALLCAVEVVSPNMQATIDARDLVEMWKNGEIKGCRVGGPFALDNAISRWCAEVKGIKSEVAGEADILVVPNIEAGNMLAKSVVYYSGASLGHVIMGARAPVLINSRTDDTEAKLNSIFLGILMSQRQSF